MIDALLTLLAGLAVVLLAFVVVVVGCLVAVWLSVYLGLRAIRNKVEDVAGAEGSSLSPDE